MELLAEPLVLLRILRMESRLRALEKDLAELADRLDVEAPAGICSRMVATEVPRGIRT